LFGLLLGSLGVLSVLVLLSLVLLSLVLSSLVLFGLAFWSLLSLVLFGSLSVFWTVTMLEFAYELERDFLSIEVDMDSSVFLD